MLDKNILMKKFVIGLMLFSLVAVPTMSLAEFASGDDIAFSETPVLEAVDSVANWIFAILLIVATISIILGGFMFLTAAGDTAKLGKARDMIIYAAVGIAVGLLAKGITTLVQTIIG